MKSNSDKYSNLPKVFELCSTMTEKNIVEGQNILMDDLTKELLHLIEEGIEGNKFKAFDKLLDQKDEYKINDARILISNGNAIWVGLAIFVLKEVLQRLEKQDEEWFEKSVIKH